MFGLLNWNYETLGYGHDLLAPAAAGLSGRAFVSNYQKLGLLRDNGISILKPNRKFAAHACNPVTGDFSPLDPATAGGLVRDATVFYQSASWLFKSGRLKKSFQGATRLASTSGDFSPSCPRPLSTEATTITPTIPES
jgi:hypothetical protein